MNALPQMKLSFYFTGDEFNLNDICRKIMISPTKMREKKDFPVNGLAHTEWILETSKEYCKAVSTKFEELITLLKGKEKIINQICDDFNIEVGFVVSIWFENGEKPEMVLSRNIISFISYINAEVGFDIYVD